MMLVLLISAASLMSGAVGQYLIMPMNCELPLDRGFSCGSNNASIRYHMDRQTLTCLAFLYEGCGGNANSFDDASICNRQCIPKDFVNCPVNSPWVVGENGNSFCGGSIVGGPLGWEKFKPVPCPANAYCETGRFMTGICCDKEIADSVKENSNPDCGPGKTAVTVEQYGRQKTLLGKSCDSHHCPSDSQCLNGAYFAYCCR